MARESTAKENVQTIFSATYAPNWYTILRNVQVAIICSARFALINGWTKVKTNAHFAKRE